MGICLDELRTLVIRPTLKHLRAWSPGVENLLLGTAAQESQLGFHLKQGRRHGLGIYQIPPHTHREIWDNYLINHPALASKVRGLASQRDFLQHPHSELATNLRYATAIAWLIYRASGADCVEATDIRRMAYLWHQYFHHGPSASARDFVRSYGLLIKDSQPAQVSAAQVSAARISTARVSTAKDSTPEYKRAHPHSPAEPKNSPAVASAARPHHPLH
jgi:hypothetical protein